jgi:hypothetical protein
VPARRTASPAVRGCWRGLGLPSRPESALRGALTWAFWGALYWAAIRQTDDGRTADRFGDDLAAGAAVGAGAGFILGAMFPSERWRRVRLP